MAWSLTLLYEQGVPSTSMERELECIYQGNGVDTPSCFDREKRDVHGGLSERGIVASRFSIASRP